MLYPVRNIDSKTKVGNLTDDLESQVRFFLWRNLSKGFGISENDIKVAINGETVMVSGQFYDARRYKYSLMSEKDARSALSATLRSMRPIKNSEAFGSSYRITDWKIQQVSDTGKLKENKYEIFSFTLKATARIKIK